MALPITAGWTEAIDEVSVLLNDSMIASALTTRPRHLATVGSPIIVLRTDLRTMYKINGRLNLAQGSLYIK